MPNVKRESTISFVSFSFVLNEISIEYWQRTRAHRHIHKQQFEHVREFNRSAYHYERWWKDKDAQQKDVTSLFLAVQQHIVWNRFDKRRTGVFQQKDRYSDISESN